MRLAALSAGNADYSEVWNDNYSEVESGMTTLSVTA